MTTAVNSKKGELITGNQLSTVTGREKAMETNTGGISAPEVNTKVLCKVGCAW